MNNNSNTGCLEKKFTQDILNKIHSFWCTRIIFTRAHRKVRRSIWWRFHSNRLTLLALAELWKKCVKIAYFCTPEDCYWKFITCLISIQKKIECTRFKFAVSIDIRVCNLVWTVVQTGRNHTTPHCSNASLEWPPPALRAPPHQPQAGIPVWSGRLIRHPHPHWTFSFGLCKAKAYLHMSVSH